jgi:hypothetical protein
MQKWIIIKFNVDLDSDSTYVEPSDNDRDSDGGLSNSSAGRSSSVAYSHSSSALLKRSRRTGKRGLHTSSAPVDIEAGLPRVSRPRSSRTILSIRRHAHGNTSQESEASDPTGDNQPTPSTIDQIRSILSDGSFYLQQTFHNLTLYGVLSRAQSENDEVLLASALAQLRTEWTSVGASVRSFSMSDRTELITWCCSF